MIRLTDKFRTIFLLQNILHQLFFLLRIKKQEQLFAYQSAGFFYIKNS